VDRRCAVGTLFSKRAADAAPASTDQYEHDRNITGHLEARCHLHVDGRRIAQLTIRLSLARHPVPPAKISHLLLLGVPHIIHPHETRFKCSPNIREIASKSVARTLAGAEFGGDPPRTVYQVATLGATPAR
jgi:hypothetical protein